MIRTQQIIRIPNPLAGNEFFFSVPCGHRYKISSIEYTLQNTGATGVMTASLQILYDNFSVIKQFSGLYAFALATLNIVASHLGRNINSTPGGVLNINLPKELILEGGMIIKSYVTGTLLSVLAAAIYTNIFITYEEIN